jgi:hypothetical protein
MKIAKELSFKVSQVHQYKWILEQRKYMYHGTEDPRAENKPQVLEGADGTGDSLPS